jgi:glutamate formiminotransferase
MNDEFRVLGNSGPLIQCIPNFSEGRDTRVLERIAESIEGNDVRLVDWSGDVDHNRSVFTFIGRPESVAAAALSAAKEAIATIDLGTHTGVHPRLGALDVLPFVPLRDITMDQCVKLARETGKRIADDFGVPVFLYDYASAAGTTLPDVRRHAFNEITPDFGPSLPHATAGAIAVSARRPLIAFNVNLQQGSLKEAREIAAELRTQFSGKVRALGLALRSRGVFQVSTNIVQPDLVSMADVLEFVEERLPVMETELIGAMPGLSAFHAIEHGLKLNKLKPGQVLFETWPE